MRSVYRWLIFTLASVPTKPLVGPCPPKHPEAVLRHPTSAKPSSWCLTRTVLRFDYLSTLPRHTVYFFTANGIGVVWIKLPQKIIIKAQSVLWFLHIHLGCNANMVINISTAAFFFLTTHTLYVQLAYCTTLAQTAASQSKKKWRRSKSNNKLLAMTTTIHICVESTKTCLLLITSGEK